MSEKHMEKLRRLGLNVAYYRKLRGFKTQEDLAEILNISRTHISNIEAPGMATSVSLELLFDIADLLEVDPAKLFEVR